MPNDFSWDRKRAAIIFVRPDNVNNRTIVQESKDHQSKVLRAAIEAAHEAFWVAYKKGKKALPK